MIFTLFLLLLFQASPASAAPRHFGDTGHGVRHFPWGAVLGIGVPVLLLLFFAAMAMGQRSRRRTFIDPESRKLK